MAKTSDPKYAYIIGEKDYFTDPKYAYIMGEKDYVTKIISPTPASSGDSGTQPGYVGGYGRGGGARTSADNGGGGRSTADYSKASLFAIAKAMLPYLGETEQANLASWLKYNAPSDTSVQPVPSAWASNMFTKQRASQAAEAIKKAALTYGADTSKLEIGRAHV